MNDPKPRRWPRRLLKLFLWTAASLVLLWTVTFALATWELNRVVAELKERGESTTFAEAVDADLRRAGSVTGADVVRQAIAANERAGRPGDALSMIGSWDAPVAGSDLAAYAAGLKTGDDVLQLADRAAELPPGPLTDTNLEGARTFSAAQDFRSVSRLLMADVKHAVAIGDSRRAFRRLKTHLSLTEHIGANAFVLPQLIRIAILGVATSSIRVTLPNADFTECELAELDALLDRLDREFKLVPALVNQRAMDASIFQAPSLLATELTERSQSPVASNIFAWRSWQAVNVVWCKLLTSPLGFPIRLRAAARSLSIPTEVLELVDVPPPWSESSHRSFIEWGEKTKIDSVTMIPAGGNYADVLAATGCRAHRMLVMARLAVRLKRFHLKHGKLPTKLEEVCDAAMPELPTKWFEKQPLKYTTTASAFRIETSSSLVPNYAVGREDIRQSIGLLMKMDFAPKK
jgi:hypothetical protein